MCSSTACFRHAFALAVLSVVLIGANRSPLAAALPEVEQLIKQLRDKDEAVRLKAAKELGRLKEKAKDAIPALMAATDDPDEDVREVAKKALATIKNAGGVEEKGELAPFIKDLKSKDIKVRLKALEALEKKGEDAKDAAKSICEVIVRDPSPNVATAALTSLEKIRPDLYKHLSVLLLDESGRNRNNALEKLSEKKKEAEPTLPIILFKCRAELTVRFQGFHPGGTFSDYNIFSSESKGPYAHHYLLAYKTIAGSDDPEVVRIYRELAGATNKDANSRWYGLKELVSWADDDEKRRKEVYPFIKAGLSDGPLLDCITFAGGYGPLSKELLPLLRRHKLSGQAAIRDAATKAVEQIESGEPKRARDILPPRGQPGGALPLPGG